MKRGEYLKQRQEYWRKAQGAFQIQAERDVLAAEAAGVKWDPEDPELPARVRISEHPELVICDAGGLGHWLLKVCYYPDHGGIELAFAKAVVAVWNAWGPEGTLRERCLEFLASPADSPLGDVTAALRAEPWKE